MPPPFSLLTPLPATLQGARAVHARAPPHQQGGHLGPPITLNHTTHFCLCLCLQPCRAPEQFTPGHRPTNKVDIWGWAATLLHMLTGAPPWAADGLLQICTAVGVAKQAPPLPQGLPGQLEGLLRGCFEADPARRPTAGAILKVCMQVLREGQLIL